MSEAGLADLVGGTDVSAAICYFCRQIWPGSADQLLDVVTISVITNDGRNIVGTLKGYDRATNVILDDCHERVYSTKTGVEQLVLGLYVIRGDNIAVVGEVDDELDSQIDLSQISAAPLKPLAH